MEPQVFEVRIDIQVSERNNYSNSIRLSESVSLGTMSFLELTGMLGRFHEVAERIKRENEE